MNGKEINRQMVLAKKRAQSEMAASTLPECNGFRIVPLFPPEKFGGRSTRQIASVDVEAESPFFAAIKENYEAEIARELAEAEAKEQSE